MNRSIHCLLADVSLNNWQSYAVNYFLIYWSISFTGRTMFFQAATCEVAGKLIKRSNNKRRKADTNRKQLCFPVIFYHEVNGV